MRISEKDLSLDAPDDRFAAAMAYCQDASGRCISAGECTYGDCFKPSGHDFLAAERILNTAIAEAKEPAIASWLEVARCAMRKTYRDDTADL